MSLLSKTELSEGQKCTFEKKSVKNSDFNQNRRFLKVDYFIQLLLRAYESYHTAGCHFFFFFLFQTRMF